MKTIIALCCVLVCAPVTSLFASSYGGGGYTRPKPKVDKLYEQGSRIYNQKAGVAKRSLDEAAFARQIVGLDQARRQVTDGKAPPFYRFAGRLKDEEYRALRHFIARRFRLNIPAGRADVGYAQAAMWFRKPTAQQELDPGVQARQLITMHRFAEATREHDFTAESFAEFAGTLPPAFIKELDSYARTNFGLSTVRVSDDDAEAYGRAVLLVNNKAADFLVAEVDPKTERSQRTWLQKFKRKIDGRPQAETVLSWAGRLQPADFNDLKQYGRLRYSFR